jgi:hypothetical protein
MSVYPFGDHVADVKYVEESEASDDTKASCRTILAMANLLADNHECLDCVNTLRQHARDAAALDMIYDI